MFREQSALWLRLLNPEGDGESWRDGAHTLKGASLGVGAFALARACEAAEAAAAASSAVRSVLLEGVRDALDAALSDISAYEHEQALRTLKTPAT